MKCFQTIITSAAAMLLAATVAAQVALPKMEPQPTTRVLFGHAFKSVPSFAGINVLASEDNDSALQIKIIKAEPDVAKEYIKDRLSMFRSIYEKRRVDYPGQHSKVIECAEEFKPQLTTKAAGGGTLSYFLGYATANKVAGACIADQIAYRYLYALIACLHPSRVLEVEGFFKMQSNGLDKLIGALGCEI